MKQTSDINQDQAQLLMSQLVDGELAAADSAKLDAYLRKHPDAQDWMENLDTLHDTFNATAADSRRSESISSIHKAVFAETSTSPQSRSILPFPAFLRPMAAAAAIALVGTATWFGLRPQAQPEFEPNTIEFLATDIPDASTFIYPDDETGWTVVWVDTNPIKTDST